MSSEPAETKILERGSTEFPLEKVSYDKES